MYSIPLFHPIFGTRVGEIELDANVLNQHGVPIALHFNIEQIIQFPAIPMPENPNAEVEIPNQFVESESPMSSDDQISSMDSDDNSSEGIFIADKGIQTSLAIPESTAIENTHSRMSSLNAELQRVLFRKRTLKCNFCSSTRSGKKNCKNHNLMDLQGNIICPVLSQMTCSICLATGKSAHTIKYCPRMTCEILDGSSVSTSVCGVQLPDDF